MLCGNEQFLRKRGNSEKTASAAGIEYMYHEIMEDLLVLLKSCEQVCEIPLFAIFFCRVYINQSLSPLSLTNKRYSMPDAFFSKPRPFSKRKREGEGEGSQRSGKPSSRNQTSTRGARGGSSSRGRGRGNGRRDGGNDRNDNKGKRRQEDEDEELDLPDDGAFDSDDQGSQQDGAAAEESSEEEDELETPAQKRLRLSQMYLQSLEKDKEGEFRSR